MVIVTINLLGGIAANLYYPFWTIDIPIQTSRKAISWDNNSFWHVNWRESIPHKGIDIFANRGTKIISPVTGFYLYGSYGEIAGNYLYVIDYKMRIHYFAHLNRTDNARFLVTRGQVIGEVGNSGNAIGKPCHLHYSIFSYFPILQKFDSSIKDGWKKMFYINPDSLFNIRWK